MKFGYEFTTLFWCPLLQLQTKEQLIQAAKARIRRMVADHATRTDLAVDSWVRDEWERGTEAKNRMAETLQAVNWSKVGGSMQTTCVNHIEILLVLPQFLGASSIRKVAWIGSLCQWDGEDYHPSKVCEGHQGRRLVFRRWHEDWIEMDPAPRQPLSLKSECFSAT